MRKLTFRGTQTKKDYFEGLYFKFVDTTNDLIVVLIPGISLFREKMAFLQYLICHKGLTTGGFLKYDVSDFNVRSPFQLLLPHGFFSEKEIRLRTDAFSLHLKLGTFTPLQTSFLNPSIMGFFEYLKMPCYHDIISLSHPAKGYVDLRGERLSFHGKGYIEGDRGSSFPDFYLWAQCNHFKEEGDSLFLSVADIPLPLLPFVGHIAVYYHKGKEVRFASYLGSRVNVRLSKDKRKAEIRFKSRKHSLLVRLELTEGGTLIAPMQHKMDFKIKEQVKANIKVLFDGKEDESSFCAAELVNWKG